MNFQQMLMWALIFGEDDTKTVRITLCDHHTHPNNKIWLPPKNARSDFFFIQDSPLSRSELLNFGFKTFESDKGVFSWAYRIDYNKVMKRIEEAGYTVIEEPLKYEISYVTKRTGDAK